MSLIIDHHVHLGTDNKSGYKLEPKELINLMNQYGINQSIVFSCPFQDFTKENPYHNPNNYILKSAGLSKGRLKPFMFIHPFLDTRKEVETLANTFSGFKLYCQAGEYDYNKLSSSHIADFVFGQKKPVIIHTGRTDKSRPKSLLDVITSFPKTPFYFAHAGRLFDDDLEQLSSKKNVYVDVSPLATMCSNPKFFAGKEQRKSNIEIDNPESVLRYLYSLFDKDKILWGSDAPWCINLLESGYTKEVEILKIMGSLK